MFYWYKNAFHVQISFLKEYGHYVVLCRLCRTGKAGTDTISMPMNVQYINTTTALFYTPLLGHRGRQPGPEVSVHCGQHELWLHLSPPALWPTGPGLSDTPSSALLTLPCQSGREKLLETEREAERVWRLMWSGGEGSGEGTKYVWITLTNFEVYLWLNLPHRSFNLISNFSQRIPVLWLQI